mmetsp:Transcript_7945/g.22154  ORF Transcript_7945/g.22154 Transcript_7945/m.22154 type:complete len:248 (+) Transcript_7945:3520-4263(+)
MSVLSDDSVNRTRAGSSPKNCPLATPSSPRAFNDRAMLDRPPLDPSRRPISAVMASTASERIRYGTSDAADSSPPDMVVRTSPPPLFEPSPSLSLPAATDGLTPGAGGLLRPPATVGRTRSASSAQSSGCAWKYPRRTSCDGWDWRMAMSAINRRWTAPTRPARVWYDRDSRMSARRANCMSGGRMVDRRLDEAALPVSISSPLPPPSPSPPPPPSPPFPSAPILSRQAKNSSAVDRTATSARSSDR